MDFLFRSQWVRMGERKQITHLDELRHPSSGYERSCLVRAAWMARYGTLPRRTRAETLYGGRYHHEWE